MPSVPTPDDVFEGLRARLAADGDFATRLPGGCWMGRRPPGKGFPYAAMTIEEPAPDYVAGDSTYLVEFVATVTVWVESADAAAADTGAARAWLDGLLGWVPGDPTNGVSVPNAVATVHVRPLGGALAVAPELRRGQDVLSAGKKIGVRVQGNRGS